MAAFSVGGGGSQPAIQWLWMDDGNRWEYYKQGESDQIELAYMTGQAGASVVSAVGGKARRGATYSVIFPTMKQINTTSSFTRSVKRSVAGNNVSLSERWQWSVGSTWQAVPLWVCAQIVASRDVRGEASTMAHLPDGDFEFKTSHMVAIQRPSAHHRPLRLVGGYGSSAPGVGAAGIGTAASLAAAAAAGGGAGGAGGGWLSAPQGAQGAQGPREREFERLVDAAQDCTALVAMEEACAVCLDGFTPLDPALLLPKCQGHYVHRLCILKTFRSLGPKCPSCSAVYAQLVGTQPDGTMTVTTRSRGSLPLSGHSTVGTIVINYNFPAGTQDQRHPNAGQPYRGTSRVAYLPDNREGREVLQLLQTCFNQKMTFTVGTSITTGISNSVIWNGVHHKTATSGGSASFGYPDSSYLSRVKQELAAKGIS